MNEQEAENELHLTPSHITEILQIQTDLVILNDITDPQEIINTFTQALCNWGVANAEVLQEREECQQLMHALAVEAVGYDKLVEIAESE